MAVTETTSNSTTNIYKYTAMMTYIVGETKIVIEAKQIKTIAIDSNYKNMNMPMLFITAAIDRRHIDLMVKNQDTGIIVLTIQRCVANSDMPDLYTDYISDRFIYFIASDINKMDELDYQGDNANRSDLYKITSFGLLSLDHINKNKKIVNGVLSGKKSSIMYYLTSHLNIVIEPPKNNIDIVQYMPPMNSVAKALKYLDSISVFYDTPYRFFIDFDCAYLLSTSGHTVFKTGEDIGTVLLNVRKFTDSISKSQGMRIDTAKSMYLIDVDSIDCEIADTHFSDKSFTKVLAADTSGEAFNKNLENTSTYLTQKTRSIRIKNDNPGVLDNMITSVNNSAIQLLIQKTDLDSSVITMNKEFIIKTDDVYDKDRYNGRYILTRKRELYLRQDENFVMNTMLLFEKLAKE